MTEKEYEISEESAEDQLNIFYDYYDIDIDDLEDDEQMEAAKTTKKVLIKSIRNGKLEISKTDDSISVVQHLQSGKDMTYAAMQGKHKVIMDKKSDRSDGYKRMYQLVGSLTSVGYDAITKLKRTDLRVVESLAFHFLL